jgi:hypothetical protein
LARRSFSDPIIVFTGNRNIPFTAKWKLLKFGFWNSALERQWIEDADYILIEAGGPEDLAHSVVQSSTFQFMGETSPVLPCRPESSFQVFMRKN